MFQWNFPQPGKRNHKNMVAFYVAFYNSEIYQLTGNGDNTLLEGNAV